MSPVPLFSLFCGLLIFTGCDTESVEVGGTCASYGTPCFCDDGRTECAPHSTNVCPCDDGPEQATDNEIAPALSNDEVPSPSHRFDPAPYAACTSDDECVAFRRQCSTVAVRSDRRDDYAATLRGVRFRCSRAQSGEGPERRAMCRDGMCTLVAIGN